MDTPSRRAFLAISAGTLCAFHGWRATFASAQSDWLGLSASARLNLANALNLRLFFNNKDAFGLAGLMTIRQVEGELGRYPDASLLLFPFKRKNSRPETQAFLPGPDAARPIIPTIAMDTQGLPPDEYFCHYLLKAPREGFIGFELGTPLASGTDKWPWHSNVQVGNDTVGIRWTSSNLNHPWFAGSRWIPDNEHGEPWRARIIAGVRRVATLAS
jgi:hypothetical protein